MTHDTDHEDRVRQRAHEIWLEEGQPSGREDQHWQQAEAEIQGSSTETNPDLSRSLNVASDGNDTPDPSQPSRPDALKARR